MRKLSNAEIVSLGNMCIADKENLLTKNAVKKIKKMTSYKKANKIMNMDAWAREKKFGIDGNEKEYDKACKTWHRLYETAIKRTPKLFIEKSDSEKIARSKYTKEDIELFRKYIYDNEIDMWYDEGYGEVGGEEKANHWLTAGRRKILNEIFWLCDTEEERTELLEQRRNNNDR